MSQSRRTGLLSGVIGTRPGLRAPAFPAGWRVAAKLGEALASAFRREAEAFDLALVVPVFLGVGIVAYFAAPEEPGLAGPALASVVLAMAAFLARRRFWLYCLLVCLAASAVGFTAARLRTQSVELPSLLKPMTAKVEGLVLSVDPRPGGGARIIVRPGTIEGLDAASTPGRIRVTLRKIGAIRAGDSLAFKALLRPPPPPAVPGGYDFARDAYFDGIGAVGFVAGKAAATATPLAASWPETFAIRIDNWRLDLTERITTLIPGESGAIAASQVTGKRGLIPKDANDALRASGLYHVVSISGLHMAIFAGALFWLIRAALALSTRLALRWQIKRLAAALCLLPAAAYTIFSGAEVATVRSFLMTAIVLLAVALNRNAVTRRNVALSASCVLLTTPEQVLGPSFQMSFAAVSMLVVSHEWWQRHQGPAPSSLFERSVRLAAAVLVGMLVTTLVASLATAPFSAFHFHRITLQSIASNMVATPIVSFMMMPLALLAVIAEPFGYAAPIWSLMGTSVDWFMWVARTVAAWPGSDLVVPQFSAAALCAFGLALLVLMLLRSFLVAVAVLPLVLGIAGAATTQRPVAIIGANGHAGLVRDGERLTALAEKRDDFAVHEWLLAMGDRRQPGDGALVEKRLCDAEGCSAALGQGAVLMLDKTASAIEEDCGRVAILVSPLRIPPACGKNGIIIDRTMMFAAGAIAIYADPPDPRTGQPRWRLERARDENSARPWARQPAKKPEPEVPAAENAAPAAATNGEDGDGGD